MRKTYDSHFKDVTECALKIANGISQAFRNKSKLAFLEFEPIISGSMLEKTKCFYPNEVDIVCLFIHTESLQVREKDPFVTLEETKETDWTSVCCAFKVVQAPMVLRTFLKGIQSVLLAGLIKQLTAEMPHLQINKYPLRFEDKIPRLVFRYNKHPFNNLQVSVDLAPVFKCPDYTLEEPLPLQTSCNEYMALVKCSRHIYNSLDDAFLLSVTFSEGEHDIMHRLPEHVRGGYVTAKAMRLASICEPGLNQQELGIIEPIDIQSFISSYVLKTCLYNLLIKIENKMKTEPKNCRFAWADEIFRELEDSLNQGKIPCWYDQKQALFGRHVLPHENHDGLVCGRKLQLMLALTQTMRSWLVSNMHNLKSNRSICRNTGTISISIGVLIMITLHFLLHDSC